MLEHFWCTSIPREIQYLRYLKHASVNTVIQKSTILKHENGWVLLNTNIPVVSGTKRCTKLCVSPDSEIWLVLYVAVGTFINTQTADRFKNFAWGQQAVPVEIQWTYAISQTPYNPNLWLFPGGGGGS